MKKLLDGADFNGRAPNKNLVNDLRSLSTHLQESGLDSIKSTIGALIDSLLDYAEQLLSQCQAVHVCESSEVSDEEEECSDVKKRESELKTSLRNILQWLEVLFRSGLAPDHSTQCPTDMEDLLTGDRAYFRLIRIKHCLSLSSRLRSSFDQCREAFMYDVCT